MKVNASVLRELDPDQVKEVLAELSPSKLEELKHTWEFWARPNQLEPEGKDWDYWIYNAGRGSGKTRTGAEWVRQQVKRGLKRIACVAPTNSDIRRVMVEGESGLLNVCWKEDKTDRGAPMGYPVWSPTNRTMTWANGAKAEFFSSEEPERLRGPQFHAAWTDEVAAWKNQQDVWDMLSFCLRLGKHPRVMVTTTPKPTKLMRSLLKHPKSFVTTGSTFDNKDNLAPTYISAIRQEFEGTRLGRQELYAEILDEASGALWSRSVLETAEIDTKDPKSLLRIVVAVDPATTSNEESDMTGIVVAGIDVNGIAYVLEDATGRFTPSEWGNKAVELYHRYEADRIVAEGNQGGEMVRHTIKTADESVPVRIVHASRGKYARAEPVSALYEQGKVKHVRGLNDLEDQMVQWEPLGSIGSPDRIDALVWAITDLVLKGRINPNLQLIYADRKGLSR